MKEQKKNSKIDFRCKKETKEQFLHLQETLNVSKEEVFLKGLEIYEKEFEERWMELEEENHDEFINSLWKVLSQLKSFEKDSQKHQLENTFILETSFEEELKKMLFLSPKEQQKLIPLLRSRIERYKNNLWLIQENNNQILKMMFSCLIGFQNQLGLDESMLKPLEIETMKKWDEDEFQFFLNLLLEIGRTYGVLDSIVDVKVKDFNDLFLKMDELNNGCLVDWNVIPMKEKMIEHLERLEPNKFLELVESLEELVMESLVDGR